MIKKYSRLVDLFKFFFLLTIVYASFIFFLSSIGDIGSHAGFLKKQYIRDFLAIFDVFGSDTIDELSSIAYDNYDKILHFIEYTVLGVLLYLTAYFSPFSFIKKYTVVFAFIAGVLFAISDEIHQFYVSGRSYSVFDMIADGMGLAFAVIIMYVIFMIRGFMKH